MRSVQPQGGRLDRASGRHTRERQRRLERGATLVEYALGVALVGVASLGAIQFLQDEAGAEYNERADRSGAPDLQEVTDGGTDGGSGSTSGSDGTDGSVPTQEVVFGGFSGATSRGNPSKWTAVIDVTVEDTSGGGVDGARVTGYWSYDAGAGVVTEEVTCNQTSNKGVCRFQISDLPAGAGSVTFTMTSIGGGVPPVSYSGGEQVSSPIAKPTGGPS